MEKEGIVVMNGLPDFSGKRCAVLGVGVSNLPLCRVLVSLGAKVTAFDKKQESEFPYREELQALGVALSLGEGYLSGLEREPFDWIFRSPGIRPDLPEILSAVKRGGVLSSEIELFLAWTPAEVIGVTGSDGKTTTTTLISRFLAEAEGRTGRRVFVGGNIGRPLLEFLPEMRESDIAVLELSSFQLMTVSKSPARAVFTNLSENHLDWHRGMEEYIEAKKNIARNPGNRLLVANGENRYTRAFADEVLSETVLFSAKREERGELLAGTRSASAVYVREGRIVFERGGEEEEMLACSEIRLPGAHNVENYLAAIAAVDGLVTKEEILRAARGFTGVEHRLERIAEANGIVYIDSSIDSTPTRTLAALSAIDRPVVLILGGRDKETDFMQLGDWIAEKGIKTVIYGEAREKIASAIYASQYYGEEGCRVAVEPEFERAVRIAAAMAVPGEAVLLSPGCTSFDCFRSYIERGRRFAEMVADICENGRE